MREDIKNMLMQKQGLATQGLAKLLAGYDLGDRIPTIDALAKTLDSSRMNIQIALKNLRKFDAVTVRARGHLGSYLEDVDYLALAEICGFQSIIGVMPLPYSLLYEGLATGLYHSLNQSQLRTSLAFMRGSDRRVETLLDGTYHFSVMSRLAYEAYCDLGHPLMEIAAFGVGSYVRKHVLMLRPGMALSDISVVGIDHSSMDQKALTSAAFEGMKVQYVPVLYSEILSALSSGKIDASVWNLDDLKMAGTEVQVEEIGLEGLEAATSEAVMVCMKDNKLLRRLISGLLDVDVVKRMQEQLLAGEIAARY